MIFEKTATTLSLHLARRLSRHRPTTVLLLFLLLATAISFISYTTITSMILTPLASLLFSFSSRAPTPAIPPSPFFQNTRTIGASPNITFLRLAMSHVNYAALPFRRPEADLLLSYLRPTDVYLEYGASATTLTIPYFVKHAFSIEHDSTVCAGISSEMLAHTQLAQTLRAFCASVPPGHAAWALNSQLEEGSFRAFRNYVDFPRTNLSKHLFDRVLINGRARVACALRVLPQLKTDSLVFFHDFFLRPAHYAAVLPFYHEVARVVATGPVHGYTDEPMGILILRPREEYVSGAAEVSETRIESIYQSFHEEAPTEETTGVDVAYKHGLQRTDEGGFPYYEMNRTFAKETARARIVLDLVAIPFAVLTYLVLRDIFNKVFVDALAGSRSLRFLMGRGRSPTLPTTQDSGPSDAKAE